MIQRSSTAPDSSQDENAECSNAPAPNLAGSSLELNLVKRSLLYREYMAEREEVMRHKWLESEKAHHDIGYEHARVDWLVKHATAWRRNRRTCNGNGGEHS